MEPFTATVVGSYPRPTTVEDHAEEAYGLRG